MLASANVPPAEVAHLAESTAHLAESLHAQHDRGLLAGARDHLPILRIQHPDVDADRGVLLERGFRGGREIRRVAALDRDAPRHLDRRIEEEGRFLTLEGPGGDPDADRRDEQDEPQGEDLLDPREPVLERMGAQVVTSKTNPSPRMVRIAHPSPSPPSLRRSRLRMTSRLSDS